MVETLKKLRTENRYSQDLLAKILGVSRISYIKYENGEVEPPLEIIRKLSKIFKVPYKTLIDNELSSEKKSFSYEYGKPKEYEVASPVPVYGSVYGSGYYSNNSINSQNVVSKFATMLAELQNKLLEMQMQINLLEKGTEKEAGFNKSKTFNKEQFFSSVGKVQIDSSYLEELRGASLI